jgi:surface protein
MFNGATGLTSLDIGKWNTASLTGSKGAFINLNVTKLDVSNWNMSKVTDMSYMFQGNSKLVALDVSKWDTSSAQWMGWMFWGASLLKTIDVSAWKTSNVGDMQWMFSGASSLQILDVSHWDTRKVTNMNWMFQNDSNLEVLDVSGWNVSKVTSFQGTFYGVSKVKVLDTHNWYVTQPANLYCIFAGLGVKSLDLSNFTINSGDNTQYMFMGLSSLQEFKLGSSVNFTDITSTYLPDLPKTNGYTGYWQNVGSGTVDNPKGTNIWTSAQLLANYKGGSQADTYVWQKSNLIFPTGNLTLGAVKDYTGDYPFQNYPIGFGYEHPTKPLNAYRYNVVINNNYPYYSQLTNGQAATSNVVSGLDDKTGWTVWVQKEMSVTDSAGQTSTYNYVSFGDGDWYWVNSKALQQNPHAVSVSQPYYGTSLSSTVTINQMLMNSFNANGQIIWTATDSEYVSQIRTAMNYWNNYLGRNVFTEAVPSTPKSEINLVCSDDATLPSSITASYNQGGYLKINPAQMASLDYMDQWNVILHEFGHAMGLTHTYDYLNAANGNVSYLQSNDLMTTHIIGFKQEPTAQEIQTIKMIIANGNFDNTTPLQ